MIPLLGEISALGAALIWSCSTSLFTVHGKGIPAQVLNLYKNGIAFVCLTLTALIMAEPMTGDDSDFAILALSGVIGLSVGDTALFAALKRLGAQVTSALQCLAPPISALLAWVFYGELLSPIEWIGMTVTMGGVTGIILASRKAKNLTSLSRKVIAQGILYAVIAAFCQGAAIVMARFALQRVDLVQGTLARVLPAMVVLVALVATQRRQISLGGLSASKKNFFWLGVASFAGTYLGLLLMSTGAKYAKAGIAAALTSTYPIWIVPIARYVLKEEVTATSAALTVISVAGIALMMV